MSYPKDLDKAKLLQYSAGFMFYIEKHKLMDIISRLLAEIALTSVDDVRAWLGANIKRIAHEIYSQSLDCFHRGVQTEHYQLPKNCFHRIVLHGRPGAGRRSLAHVLAARWNLLIIDADVLAQHYINGEQQDELAKQLQLAIENDCVYGRSQAIGNIIEQRLLKEDALKRGWILYNYPNNRCEARQLFEAFTVPPNRFVYLQIDERMARMRVVSRPYDPRPQATSLYLDHQMKQFRKSEPALNSYLSRRREVLHVDASACFEDVKCRILSVLTKTPYVLGYKYGCVTDKD